MGFVWVAEGPTCGGPWNLSGMLPWYFGKVNDMGHGVWGVRRGFPFCNLQGKSRLVKYYCNLARIIWWVDVWWTFSNCQMIPSKATSWFPFIFGSQHTPQFWSRELTIPKRSRIESPVEMFLVVFFFFRKWSKRSLRIERFSLTIKSSATALNIYQPFLVLQSGRLPSYHLGLLNLGVFRQATWKLIIQVIHWSHEDSWCVAGFKDVSKFPKWPPCHMAYSDKSLLHKKKCFEQIPRKFTI